MLSTTMTYAQIGINTNDPKATLEVKGEAGVITKPDGIIAPNITRAELIAKTAYSTAQTGAIVYVTDLSGTVNTVTNKVLSIGYYYFNGNVWNSMNASTAQFTYGDIKTGIQTTDHDGWVKLDGRLKSDLTATQQAQATTLGIGTNLPDATDSVLMQNGSALGSVSGSNLKTIVQSNLPNITLTGTAASAGSHQHYAFNNENNANNDGPGSNLSWSANDTSNQGINSFSADQMYTQTVAMQGATSSDGAHTHTVTTSSLNGGVTQTTIDITPKSLSIIFFIYLGL
jgi:hypothetical protein